MGLPNIVVEFITRAKTAISRSERGIVCLLLHDTKENKTLYEYKSVLDILEEDWTPENLLALHDAFHDGPSKVYAVKLGENESLTDVETVLDSLKINWIAEIGETQTNIVSYVKKRNLKPVSAPIKAVVFCQTADDMHIVNFANATVTRTGGASVAGYKYLARIAGLLAAMPLDRSATYYKFDDLEAVTNVEKADETVGSGQFVLLNDYGTVKVARAVNSATTVENEDLKKITIVEGMDLMKEDIVETFKEQYVGKYKNSLDNQSIFLAAVNTYFRQLAMDGVLSPDFENLAQVDIEKQRKRWADAGTTEALDWDDAKVKNSPFKTYVFLSANVRFMDAIEDLEFDVYMN